MRKNLLLFLEFTGHSTLGVIENETAMALAH